MLNSSAGGVSGSHAAPPPASAVVAPASNGEFNTLRTPLIPFGCWKVDDVRFEFGSSFVQPAIRSELAELRALIAAHTRVDDPGGQPLTPPLSVFGHADPIGDDAYNKTLSGRRAQAIYALLSRNAELWEDLFSKRDGTADDWGIHAVQVMLDAVGHPPGSGADTLDAPTSDALKAFQRVKGLAESGKADKPTRNKLFLAYMDALCGADFVVAKSDFLAHGDDRDGKGDYQGCSEFNPLLLLTKQEVQALSKPDQIVENAPNRRVMVLLFRPGSRIDPKRWPCPRAKEGSTGCRKRFWSDGEQRRSTRLPDARRKFEETKDTFGCRFYDRMTNTSPCERLVDLVQPTFFTIEQPGAKNFVRMHSLWTYVAYFAGSSANIETLAIFEMKEGQLFVPKRDGTGKIVRGSDERAKIFCQRAAFFYFSHRDDLLELDTTRLFARDRSGLPLLGPITVTCGPDAKIELDIWEQNDWVIVRGPRVDGERPDTPLMAEWREDYSTGQLLPMVKGGMGFFPNGDQRLKTDQERWKGQDPIPLVHLGNPGTNPLWAGTLSALPTSKAKILLFSSASRAAGLHVASYNELAPTGRNVDLPGHHRFDRRRVASLMAVPASDQPNAVVDGLPVPPARVLLPGDMCWQDQGQTNNCGAFSFSTAMNYWMPYTNNPTAKDGKLYSRPGNVDDTINGARTPKDIVNAGIRFRMNARDNDAEELDRERALKLVKLWLNAGVPVVILVEEEYNVWSLHWKTVVGFDGDRFFMNNSGADNEVVRANRTLGVDYEHAPVGNDVDSARAFFDKWKAAGGDVVDLITSVDECTFIPIFPKDPMFSGDKLL